MDEIEEAQNILMKWLMSDHTGVKVTIAEMHKVKKLIYKLRAENKLLEAKIERLKANLDNYALLEECSPPDWPRKDFVKHLWDLWDKQE